METSKLFHAGELMPHGSYGEYIATDVIRHGYWGSDPDADDQGYYEVLEFPNPPEGKPKAVSHFFSTVTGHALVASESVVAAVGFVLSSHILAVIRKERPIPGYLKERMELLGKKRPWFFCPYVRVTRIPPGITPWEVRRAWVGIVLPTMGRETGEFRGLRIGAQNCGGYRVAGGKALALLREYNKIAAERLEENFPNLGEAELIFSAEVCEEV